MTPAPQVLVIDDQIGDLRWLFDLLRYRGYDVRAATNEKEGRERLRAVQAGTESYALAVIDVMMATHPIEDLVDLDDQFFAESRDTGIRLCKYARLDLAIPRETLPIVCLTVRNDDEVKQEIERLGIPLFNRVPDDPDESIREHIKKTLPERPASTC